MSVRVGWPRGRVVGGVLNPLGLSKKRSALDIDQLPRQAAEGNPAYFYFRFAGR
jgi:hypothetical protein